MQPDLIVNQAAGSSPMMTTLATPLTAADRCDRCGARAYLRARLQVGGTLLFCAHHGREHVPALRKVAEIDDLTDQLQANAPSAAPE